MTDVASAIADLNRITVDLSTAGVRATIQASRLVRKTALDIVATAQQLVPVDTAATKNSIYAGATGTDRPMVEGDLDVEIGPTTEYAPYLEYGTSRMAPHAFMGPAFDRHVPDFVAGATQLGGDLL